MQRSLAAIGALLLATLGCQASAVSTSPTESAAPPVSTVAAQQAVATGPVSVWGEVPKQCA
jgi:hypothetical protein